MGDITCLADGFVQSVDFNETGLNANELVVGPTGSGKSFSNAYSRLLHTTESSVVVPIAKGAIKNKFYNMFVKRGYDVIDLNFADMDSSECGYDPFDYIKTDEDILQVSDRIIQSSSKDMLGNNDPYWSGAAKTTTAAIMSCTIQYAKDSNKKPCFADFLELHRSVKIEERNGRFYTSIDKYFQELEIRHPGNQASEWWKTIHGLSSKTASCVWSIVNYALADINSEAVSNITRRKKRIVLKDIGKKKTALFITTSPFNKATNKFVNIMYGDLFRELFNEAESNEDYKLKIPVHIICDDFACTSKIEGFADYISIFRAAGISVTMLLQSETQLTNMYGETDATTIINNCDTYVYLGGMDNKTCENVSKRANVPLKTIAEMPLEQVYVFRRGWKCFKGRRYQTLNDSEYIKLFEKEHVYG